jgi:hypothetical protein
MTIRLRRAGRPTRRSDACPSAAENPLCRRRRWILRPPLRSIEQSLLHPRLESLVGIIERIEVGVIGQAAEQLVIDGPVVLNPSFQNVMRCCQLVKRVRQNLHPRSATNH